MVGVVSLVLMIAAAVMYEFRSSRHPSIDYRARFECRALYAASTTPAETTRVDLTHPALANQENPNLPTCGTLRRLGELEVEEVRSPEK